MPFEVVFDDFDKMKNNLKKPLNRITKHTLVQILDAATIFIVTPN
jgi:hypothetical protein